MAAARALFSKARGRPRFGDLIALGNKLPFRYGGLAFSSGTCRYGNVGMVCYEVDQNPSFNGDHPVRVPYSWKKPRSYAGRENLNSNKGLGMLTP